MWAAMAERNPTPTPAGNPNASTLGGRHHHDDELDHEPTDGSGVPDGYTVVFSMGWVVQGAETGQDAINIAVSEVGKRIASTGKQTRKVNICVQRIGCNSCGLESDTLLLVSETALVGLFIEIEVDAEDPETAEKIARHEVGPHLHNTPLTSVNVSPAN
jgi:uncharacterized protein (UPF0212 family)